MNLSIPLVLEYEDVCVRLVGRSTLTRADVDAAIDYLCRIGNHREIYYLWRPSLPDPQDEMVLELAISEGAEIVTFNTSDFKGAEQFGVRVLTPGQFLKELEALP